MYMVWHVDKYKITFKLVIIWTNENLVAGLSQLSIIDARARYQAAARRSRNTALQGVPSTPVTASLMTQGTDLHATVRYG